MDIRYSYVEWHFGLVKTTLYYLVMLYTMNIIILKAKICIFEAC